MHAFKEKVPYHSGFFKTPVSCFPLECYCIVVIGVDTNASLSVFELKDQEGSRVKGYEDIN